MARLRLPMINPSPTATIRSRKKRQTRMRMLPFQSAAIPKTMARFLNHAPPLNNVTNASKAGLPDQWFTSRKRAVSKSCNTAQGELALRCHARKKFWPRAAFRQMIWHDSARLRFNRFCAHIFAQQYHGPNQFISSRSRAHSRLHARATRPRQTNPRRQSCSFPALRTARAKNAALRIRCRDEANASAALAGATSERRRGTAFAGRESATGTGADQCWRFYQLRTFAGWRAHSVEPVRQALRL